MKNLSILCSLAALLATARAKPVQPREIFSIGAANRLSGSSFGAPGDQTFDYVIVGGGTAGLALAKRLSENPAWSVAVVEAGGFYEFGNSNVSQIPLFGSAGSDKSTTNYNPVVDWGFVTEPQQGANNEKIHYARGKCLGGSSARNYMAYQRGTKKTYDRWAADVGDSAYSWNSFLPFLQKSVHFTAPDTSKRAGNATPEYDLPNLGPGRGNGPVSVTFSNYAMAMSSWVQKGLAEIGVKPIKGFTSGKLLGSSYVMETIDATTQLRETSETAFLRPALQNPNLIVFKQSLAKIIKFDKAKRATGVVVVTAGRKYTLSAKREVILSAGTFQSPQLLMVSGIGPKATLEKFGIPVVKELAGVGQNMIDHIFFGPSYRANVVSGSSLGNPTFAAKAVSDLLERQSGILTNAGGDFFAFEKLPAAARTGFSPAVVKALSDFPEDWPEVEYLSVGGFLGDSSGAGGPTDSFNYISVVAALVAPLSRGTVSISSADSEDPPLIDPRWLTDPADQAVAIAAYRRLRQFFSTEVLKPVLIGPEYYPGAVVTSSDESILSEIRKAFNTVWHAAATCKMGKATDPMAVVDSQARVFGVTGLRVVDASAFALLPPGHPVSTIYGLAEKIANDIKTKPLNSYK